MSWADLWMLRVLACYSWPRKVPWQGCSGLSVPLTKNCLVPEQLSLVPSGSPAPKLSAMQKMCCQVTTNSLKKMSQLAKINVRKSVKLS